jgi:hypothetical protein
MLYSSQGRRLLWRRHTGNKRFRYSLLMCLGSASGGTVNLFSDVTSTCIVTSLPTNAIVANDCTSTPGISEFANGNLGIRVDWGEDLFELGYEVNASLDLSNGQSSNPNYVATEAVTGHLDYHQDFVITGGSGDGFITSFLTNEIASGEGGSCGVAISTGETDPNAPRSTVPFTFGVPFDVQIFVDVNSQISAPYMWAPSKGPGCQNDNYVQLFNSQGQSLTDFDVEPVPEPQTWALVAAGLLGCCLMTLKSQHQKRVGVFSGADGGGQNPHGCQARRATRGSTNRKTRVLSGFTRPHGVFRRERRGARTRQSAERAIGCLVKPKKDRN